MIIALSGCAIAIFLIGGAVAAHSIYLWRQERHTIRLKRRYRGY